MESTKKYYKYLDILRVLSCIAVFAYHLGYLKGGYLAVCSFFVLSGYLSYISASKKEKFSLLNYYKERFLHIYLPFIMVVLTSIGILYFIPNVNWLNLKPETTSTILGYNNFWQLQANLDYFTRHIDSPFMHFWYMGILLQFEIAFPIIFLLLKETKEKTKKWIPCLILGIITILTTLYFSYIATTEADKMIVYYHTLTRSFSIFLGMFLGSIHAYYHTFTIKKINPKIPFFIYLFLFILECLFISAESPYFIVAMIGITLITARLISYGTMISQDVISKKEKGWKILAKISYEIYLFQYPIIYIFQFTNHQNQYKVPLIVISTILLSLGLHFALDKQKEGKKEKIQTIILLVFLLLEGFGLYQYVIAEDHTKEIQELENQLNANQEIMQKKQNEYAEKLKQEQEVFISSIKLLEENESNLEEQIHNLPIIGVGDSVMLGAVSSLYSQFPNGYFDAKVSRTDYEANKILQDLKSQNLLGNPILINLGTNGQCGISCQNEILNTIENRKLFWINVVNDAEVHVNQSLNQFAESHDNVFIIDWNTISNGHPEYFAVDGIHLTGAGREVYANAIYQNIYENYKQDFQNQKEEILRKQQQSRNEKISFYGKEILISAYPYLEENMTEYQTDFHTEKEKVEEIIEQIKKDSTSDFSANNIVLVLDTKDDITKEIKELKNIPANIYLINTSPISYQKEENITIIDFYSEIQKHKDYMMIDQIHLNDTGNEALLKIVQKEIKEKNSYETAP